MKIVSKYKKLDLSKDFVVIGTKEQLLEFEKILQANGVKDRTYWNNIYRNSIKTNYIVVYESTTDYSYHSHNCQLTPINVETFLNNSL